MAPRTNANSLDGLKAAIASFKGQRASLRQVAKLHGVSKSTLHRSIKKACTGQRRGRRPVLSAEHEIIIRDAILEFARQATPLTRDCIRDLIKDFIHGLPQGDDHKNVFKDSRPSRKFVTCFLKRHPELALRRRAGLEQVRVDAMSPTIMATHFARLHHVYQKFNIVNPSQIFNIDESGFSVKSATRTRTKAVFDGNERPNALALKWAENADHTTIMPVVSADGSVWTPVVIIPGARAKYRTRDDGIIESPGSFLPPNAVLGYREPAGMDTELFKEWAKNFIHETTALRAKYKYLVLTYDGYGAHVNYEVLRMFKDAGIACVALPAHTSHRTQVLDYSVFAPFKNELRNLVNKRAVVAADGRRNDIYTLCEILHEAYKVSLTYRNVVNGFQAVGIWCNILKGPKPEVMRAQDFTNTEHSCSKQTALVTYMELYETFKKSRDFLTSDGGSVQNKTLTTARGALLTSESVLECLRDRELRRQAANNARAQRESAQVARREQRERDELVRLEERERAKSEHAAFARWLADRPQRLRRLSRTRTHRRLLAKQRKQSTESDT